MGITLGGTMFVRNGIRYDYCFREAIASLLSFCDKVVVVDAGSDDGTDDELIEIQEANPDKLKIILDDSVAWNSIPGKEKLVHYTDEAIRFLETDWNFYLQADEILHETSIPWIRRAITEDQEGFHVSRINLWKNPFMRLNVPQNRMPCSPIVLRLARTEFRSYGDAESLATNTCSDEYVDRIKIYHMGFVRRREVMKEKIINMQEKVFGMMGHDPKLDGHETFQPNLWFDDSELEPIKEPLPRLIQKWALDRI